jgi:hypothetical protein
VTESDDGLKTDIHALAPGVLDELPRFFKHEDLVNPALDGEDGHGFAGPVVLRAGLLKMGENPFSAVPSPGGQSSLIGLAVFFQESQGKASPITAERGSGTQKSPLSSASPLPAAP